MSKDRVALQQKLIDRAATDAEFRALLLSDPRAAIKAELNIDLPAAISLTVHEESSEHLHLVLPTENADELSDAQLEMAGGFGGVGKIESAGDH